MRDDERAKIAAALLPWLVSQDLWRRPPTLAAAEGFAVSMADDVYNALHRGEPT